LIPLLTPSGTRLIDILALYAFNIDMKIAIISDTHDNINAVEQGVAELFRLKPELIIHCGDISSPSTMERFQGLPIRFVFGNCDWDEPLLQAEAKALGFEPIEHTLQLELANKKIFVCHGDRANVYQQAVSSQSFDYIFHGHTHMASDSKEGNTRIINPGALYRAQQYTFAQLDLSSDKLSYITLNKGIADS